MGLFSALNTSLTGLSAAETSIDVAGNNVANSNTVGFKESKVSFATQFLQTQSIGSAPTDGRGGTNPRQIGLGVKVAQISPQFTQGTVQLSSNPLDLAIQGDGFFVVQGPRGANDFLYTRNGQFRTNASNQIVTTTGQRLVGYGVDENYEVDRTQLGAINIPLGAAAVAQATQTVYMEGALNPNGAVGTIPGIIQSNVLSDGTKEVPPDTTTFATVQRPNDSTILSVNSGGSLTPGGVYSYRVTFSDAAGNETSASNVTPGISPIVAGSQTIDLSNIPALPSSYTRINLYRNNSTANNEYRLVTQFPTPTAYSGGNYTDAASDASIAGNTLLNDQGLATATYNYYVTFHKNGFSDESRPAVKIGPVSADSTTNPRILLSNIPSPTTGDYNEIYIYRSLASNPAEFHRIATLPSGQTTYIDSNPDSAIVGNPEVNLEGPPINNTLKLLDLVSRNGATYSNPFKVGTLSFTGDKGGRALGTQTLSIHDDIPASGSTPFQAATTVGDLIAFMEQSLGIVTSVRSSETSFPDDAYSFGGDSYTLGGSIVDSKLTFRSNMGTANEVGIDLAAFQLTPEGAVTSETVPLAFASIYGADDPVGDQGADGATADFVVYDSLGSAVNVRMTTVLEEKTETEARFRWIAVSADNRPDSGNNTVVGTGILITDSNGRFVGASNDTVAIERNGPGGSNAESPLQFDLDFSQVTGLDNGNNEVQASRQDGFPAGTLSSFIITETGLIEGVFTNGSTRDLGQILMARFANNSGLEQRGDNLFAAGVNSGNPILGDPGSQGIGNITAGAVELSNTDIGQNLIQLILASTQYRGGARVITAVQQLLDELLNLRR